MAVTLKIKPYSGTLADARNVEFELIGLDRSKDLRVSFENATHGVFAKPHALSDAVSLGPRIEYDQEKYAAIPPMPNVMDPVFRGRLDLRATADSDSNVITIFANIEERSGRQWHLRDIAAFAFQIENPSSELRSDRIKVSPAFVSGGDRATIEIQSDPHSVLRVTVNGKQFVIRAGHSGAGSISFRGIDVLAGSPKGSRSLQRFPVYFSRQEDGFQKVYDSGSAVHYIPESMKVLQATADLEAPECAIFDLDPGPGQRLQTVDDFCFNGAAVGEYSIFNSDSSYYDSRAGFCGDIHEGDIDPLLGSGVCRIQNSTSATVLPNGSGLIAFSSAYDPTSDEGYSNERCPLTTLASRIFIAHISSSLKYRGNPVRNGTIMSPAQFYHTVYFNEVADGEAIGVEFRLLGGDLFEIQITSGSTVESAAAAFADAARTDSRVIDANIEVLRRGDEVDLYSNGRFSIRSIVRDESESDIEVCLNTNKTLKILSTSQAVIDSGDTVVFLDSQLGSQSYSITEKEDRIIRIEVPEGVNNNIGPTIQENIYCQKFVVVDGLSSPTSEGLSDIGPLPYIKDRFHREIPSVYPSIAARKDYVDDHTYVYCVCQAPITDGSYQLFYYAFRLGEEIDQESEWTQLTFEGENKNPVIRCDGGGNLHIVWESDRIGSTQIYYGVLGPGSRAINNQILMSVLDREAQSDLSFSLFSVESPEAIEGDWYRCISGAGAVSLVSGNEIAVEANPAEDGSLAVYVLDRDADGIVFDGLYSQLSFQVSFDLNIPNDVAEIWDERKIDTEYKDWLAQFTPVGENRYEIDGNRFSLDRVEPYFDRIIPIVGSYKINPGSLTPIVGGADASGFNHAGSAEYLDFSDPATLGHEPNVKHFVLALMPEKVRFKAVNLDPLFTYCSTNDMDVSSCVGYTDQIENIHYTGKYRLALLLATSENDSTGSVSQKTHTIVRQFGDLIDFSAGAKSIKIGVHYSKTNSDFIANMLRHDSFAIAQNYRFYGDIVVAVDDAIKIGQSFAADFSDQYRQFDIGFGVPSAGHFLTNEILPHNGNAYEDQSVLLHYDNICVGKHSIRMNDDYVDISECDRSASQIIVESGGLTNLISNGSFETSVIPLQDSFVLNSGSSQVSGWTAFDGPIYRFDNETSPEFRAYDGEYMIELGGLDAVSLASIAASITTVIGKTYLVRVAISPHPNASTEMEAEVTRTFSIAAGPTTATGSVIQPQGVQGMRWEIRYVQFVADSAQSTISIRNTSGSHLYGLMIDDVQVYAAEEIHDELSSDSAADSLLISDDEYNLAYSLRVSNGFTQIPITLSETDQNRNPDLFVDVFDKPHIAWQSNRHGPWQIYYSGSRYRSLPFRFETRITDTLSSAIEPSVSADTKGRRMVVWQDNRNGHWQIYGAVSNVIDEQYSDQCKYDESDQYVWEVNQIDPYDPYSRTTDSVGCLVTFDFDVPVSGIYHFSAEFYSDRERTQLYKKVSSRFDIAGWRVDDQLIDSTGASLSGGSTAVVTYGVSREDDLSGQIYYVTLKYEGDPGDSGIDTGSSSSTANIEYLMLEDLTDLDISLGARESDTIATVFREFEGESLIARAQQSLSVFGGETVFQGDLENLPGFSIGDRISSYYVHFDPAAAVETQIEATIVFEDPIASIIFSHDDLESTDVSLGFSAVTYNENDDDNRGVEFPSGSDDFFDISEDRKTIIISLTIGSDSWSNLRIVTTPTYDKDGNADFVFYCAAEQSSRCDVNVQFSNDTDEDQELHFRTTFYADAERENAILSSFTALSTVGWTAGSGGFPLGGITISARDSVSVNYDPEILPFQMHDSQNTGSGPRSQSLLCGVLYYVVIEAYTGGGFNEIDSYTLICPCAYAKPSIWRDDEDSSRWTCSGQGGSDKRISMTVRDAIRPQLVSAENSIFYAVWEDYRYSGSQTGQPVVSPDYFFGLWDSENNELHCSGQGGFDRRITYYSDEGNKILHDHSVFIDPFQNLNTIFHDEKTIYSRACSIGCLFETSIESTPPCLFTDGTDTDFYQIGGSPERDTDQYMKIRLAAKNVAFSTYLDIDSPISVVNDCFVELDIIGVPGTYAYRLKNESDEEWTAWLPIGSDLPEQPSDTEAIEAERNFFRAKFIGKDRFSVPWVSSPKNGMKRVCCEILTFFGKTEQFCLDFMAMYKELEYSVDFFYDSDLTAAVPKYNHMPVVSTKRTATLIEESNLTPIGEDTSAVSNIYVKITFRDVEKINMLAKMAVLDRFDYFGEMSMDVYQQGLRDQIGLAITKISDGVYSGSFSVEEDDTVVNVDGLSAIVVNVPGNCRPISFEEVSERLNDLLSSNSLVQQISVFNDMTIFRDQYVSDDIRNSFGDPAYYKTRNFGSSGNSAGGKSVWPGGGNS